MTVVDGTGAPARAGMTLVLEGERSADLHDDGAKPLPPAAERLDLAGRTVIPGLIEAHTHLQDFHASRDRLLSELERWLYGGVVALREMAGDARISGGELDRAARLGQIPSPDIHFAAVMMGPHFRSMDGVGSALAQEHAGRVNVLLGEHVLRRNAPGN